MAKIIGLRRKLVTMTKRSRVFQTVEVFALSLSIFVILATGTNAAAIDSPSNTNKQSAVANSSTNEKLIEKQNELEQSYQNTLLNASLLPFASECHDVMSPTSRVNSPMDKRLCAAYYDMMNNLHETRSTGYQSIDDVRVTLHEYDNSTLVNNFCSLFPGELPLEDNKRLFEKQLFPGGTPLGTDLKNETVKCNLYCFELVNSDMQLKPICKLISGGYRAIKLVSSSNVDIFKTNNEKKEKVDSSVIQPLNTHAEPETVKKENAKSVEPIHINAEPPPIHHPVPSVVSSTKPVANSHKPITPNKAVPVERVEQAEVPKKILETPKINTKIEETPQIQTEEEKPEKPQISKIDVVPKENPAKAAIQNKVDSDEYLPANNNDDENDYDMKGQNDDEIKDSKSYPNSFASNLKSQNNLPDSLAAINDQFRQDNDSNFFSYFIFLMFVSVAFYVVYHNKTKVLALVIEGRRSRNYSRNGSRRKQHSAEYRKLDSNLEEAIQSSGQFWK